VWPEPGLQEPFAFSSKSIVRTLFGVKQVPRPTITRAWLRP